MMGLSLKGIESSFASLQTLAIPANLPQTFNDARSVAHRSNTYSTASLTTGDEYIVRDISHLRFLF